MISVKYKERFYRWYSRDGYPVIEFSLGGVATEFPTREAARDAIRMLEIVLPRLVRGFDPRDLSICPPERGDAQALHPFPEPEKKTTP